MSQSNGQTIFLKGRIRKPQLPSDLVPRPRLFGQLELAYQHPFTLICAPAGYGKSTLLSSWLEDSSIPFVWLTIDESLNNFKLFLNYLVTAVQDIFPGALEQFAALLTSAQMAPGRTLTAVFCEDLFEIGQEFFLILDDYHFIQDERIHLFWEGVIENGPFDTHHVMTTRWDPNLPLLNWRSKGRMVELRGDQLLFRPEEAQAFLEQAPVISLSAETRALLSNRTEGWITGLRLATLSIQQAEDPEKTARKLFSGPNTQVSAYLFEQVFASLPEDIQDFLIKTSFLKRICAGLCEALEIPASSNSQAVLDFLIQANLFLVFDLEHRQHWYRYHHLLREDLRMRLKMSVSAEETARLHRRAGEWMQQEGYVEEAVEQFLAAGEIALAARLVENELLQVMDHENWFTLDRMLERIPETLVDERPLLLLAKVLVLHFQFRLAAISALLDRAETLLAKDAAGLNPKTLAAAHGLIQMSRSQIAFFSGDMEGTIQYGQEGLKNLSGDFRFVQGVCELYRSLGLQMDGREKEAVRWLERQIESSTEPLNGRSVRHLMALCQISQNIGFLSRGEQYGVYLFENSQRNGYPIGAAWGLYTLGRTALEQGQFDRAQPHFESVVEAPYRAHLLTAHECFLGLALVYQAKGARELADRTLDSAEKIMIAANNHTFLGEIQSLRARLALQRGEPEQAVRLLQHLFDVPLPESPFLFLELPHLTLARVWTASRQTIYLDRALKLLDQLLDMAVRTHNRWRQTEILAVKALALSTKGEHEAALNDLQQAIRFAGATGVVQMLLELRPEYQFLIDKRKNGAYLQKIFETLPIFSAGLKDTQTNAAADLTSREVEILTFLEKRMTYAEIANTLFISPLTVKTHAVNAYKKLGVRGRKNAVALARQLGLL